MRRSVRDPRPGIDPNKLLIAAALGLVVWLVAGVAVRAGAAGRQHARRARGAGDLAGRGRQADRRPHARPAATGAPVRLAALSRQAAAGVVRLHRLLAGLPDDDPISRPRGR